MRKKQKISHYFSEICQLQGSDAIAFDDVMHVINDMKCQGISVVVTLCSTRTYDYQHWDSFLSLPHPRFSQLRLLPC